MFLLIVIIPKSGILSCFSKLRWNCRSSYSYLGTSQRHVCSSADNCTTYNKTVYIPWWLRSYRLQEWSLSQHSCNSTPFIAAYVGTLFHEKTIFFLKSFSFFGRLCNSAFVFPSKECLRLSQDVSYRCAKRYVKICVVYVGMGLDLHQILYRQLLRVKSRIAFRWVVLYCHQSDYLSDKKDSKKV